MHLRFLVVLPLLAGLGLAEPALANPPAPPAAVAPVAHVTMADRARAFAAKYNLPVREIQVNAGGRISTRVFIPVTAATHDAFVKEFAENGAVIRQLQNDKEHVAVALAPNDVIEYPLIEGSQWQQRGFVQRPVQGPQAQGLYLALDLSAEEKAHFKATAAEAQKKQGAGCMSWLTNGCVAPDSPLAHKLGVKQSRAPSNLIKKFIHAGNENVVVGVPISEAAGSQVAALRNQLAPLDQRIMQVKAQIQQLEQQGGGRGRAFEEQIAPQHAAIAQLDAVIAARAEKQPAIAAGLRARKDAALNAIHVATEQHEAPFHKRVAELDASITQAKNTLKQLEGNRDIDLKGTRDQLAIFEKQKADLERFAPAQGKPNRYERRLAEIDHAITQVHAQREQFKGQLDNQRAQAKAQITHAEGQLHAAIAEVPRDAGARPENVAAYNQRLELFDQTARNLEQAIAQHQAAPGYEHQLDAWKQALAEAHQERAQLMQAGPAHFNPAYNQRLAQLDQQIAQVRTTLSQNPVHPQAAQWLAQLNTAVGQREALVRQGPVSYNPQLEARIAQLDAEITQSRANIERFRAQPQYKAQVPAWQAALDNAELLKEELGKLGPARYTPVADQRITQIAQTIRAQKQQLYTFDLQEEQTNAQYDAQITQQQNERQAVAQKGPAGYHPEFDAELARIDAQITQTNNNINAWAPQPRYAPNVAQQRQVLAGLQQQRAQLVAQNPAEYNPQYTQRIAQLDAQIAQNRTTVAQYEANPAYAPHVPGARAQLEQNVALREELGKLGPAGYDPQFDQKLSQAVQQIANTKQQLQAKEAQHAVGIDAARTALTNQQSLKDNLVHHGALHYNPAYEQRITQIDAQIAQTENSIKQYAAPQYAANRQQWAAQVAELRKTRDEVMAQGPAAYNPNEPQLRQLRQQLQQSEDQAAPIRQQIALAEAAADAKADLAKQFAAIPDHILLGPPPGGEAAHH